MRDHLVGRVKDGSGGTVILLELNDHSVRIVLFKIEDIPYISAAPAVDALVVVTHDTKIPALRRQKPYKLILCLVRILVFIHQHVTKAPPVDFKDGRMLGKELQRFQQQIIKIERVLRLQPLLINGHYVVDHRIPAVP